MYMLIVAIIVILALIVAPILLIRFRKRWVAAFNKAVTNRITNRFAGRLPGFALLSHTGRRSGRIYRTPVNVFRTSNGFLMALTYSREAEWVKNVLAAGGAQLETRGARYKLQDPMVVHDPARQNFPPIVRSILWLIGAADFMQPSIDRKENDGKEQNDRLERSTPST
jgi:deazaflavin-dependent oxidoreductase (nitroreductase family)